MAETLLKDIDDAFVKNDALLIEKTLNNIYSYIDELSQDDKDAIAHTLSSIAMSHNTYMKIYLYSFLLHITQNSTYADAILSTAARSPELNTDNRLYIINQLRNQIFRGLYDTTSDYSVSLFHLYREVVNSYRESLSRKRTRIDISKRNKKFVLVLTDQFLSTAHGPSKSALGRCIALKKMGYDVILINSAEMVSTTGSVPFFKAQIGSFNSELSDKDSIMWKGFRIPYFQCDNNMPNTEVIEYLLDTIESMAPYFAVAIGGNGILTQLVNDIVPTIAIGMIPSQLPFTLCSYRTLGRQLTDADIDYLNRINIDPDTVIVHRFTSDIVEQTAHRTRNESGIPEDCFLIAIVGGRIEIEITTDFMDFLKHVSENNSHIRFIFLGPYNRQDYIEKNYPALHKNIIYAGFQSDILSWLELADLYINPIRTGGGTSCVEAMSKGVPVISTGYGDVAVNAGPDFITDDYNSMEQLVYKYIEDNEFYATQSEKALIRSNYLLDTESAFKEVIEHMLSLENI